MSSGAAPGPGNPDQSWFREVLHRHLPHIAERVSVAANAAVNRPVPQFVVSRAAPRTAAPADEAIPKDVLSFALEHTDSLYKV